MTSGPKCLVASHFSTSTGDDNRLFVQSYYRCLKIVFTFFHLKVAEGPFVVLLGVLFYGFVLAVKVVEGCEAIRVKVRLWY